MKNLIFADFNKSISKRFLLSIILVFLLSCIAILYFFKQNQNDFPRRSEALAAAEKEKLLLAYEFTQNLYALAQKANLQNPSDELLAQTKLYKFEGEVLLKYILFQEKLETLNQQRAKNFNEIKKTILDMDSYAFEKIYKKNIHLFHEEYIYNEDIHSLYARLVKNKGSIALGETFSDKIRASSLLHYMISFPMLSLAAMFFVVIMNANNWSVEFTSGGIRLLLTQPFSRRKSYYSKVIVKLFITLISLSILLFLPSIVSFFIGGTGSDISVLINPRIFDQLFVQFSPETAFFSLISTSIWTYIKYYYLLFISVAVFIFSLTNILSLVLKDSGGVVISVCFLSCLLIVPAPFNPFSYIRIPELLSGNLGYGYWSSLLILMALSIFLITGGSYLLKRYQAIELAS